MSIITVKLEAKSHREDNMEPGARVRIRVDALRDIRDALGYWYKYAAKHQAAGTVRNEYLDAWSTLADLCLEVNH